MNFFPKFKNDPACAEDSNPEAWFPEFDAEVIKDGRAGMRSRYSRTPEAMRARNICLNCPAYDECLEYSLKFKDLTGIWANLDTYERAIEQRVRGITPLSLPFTYDNPLDHNRAERVLPESGWENELR